MIQVTVGNNLKREKVLVNPNSTLRQVLEDAEVDYSRGVLNLDGSPIEAGGLNRTFAELG